jgi:hypothetical protein
MFRLLRMVLFIPQPRITRERALEIAHRECKRLGWLWRDPALVDGLRTWLIWTVGGRGARPFVVVNQQTGEVVKIGRPPMRRSPR